MQSRDPLEFSSSLASLVVTDHALDDTLLRVAVLSTRDVPGCDVAGITLLRDGRPVTAVFTDPSAPHIDTAQYDTGKGPCLDAFRHGQEFRIEDTRLETRWPEFAAAAAAGGVLSTLSLPLVVGRGSLGALNLYSYTVSAFVDDEGGRRVRGPGRGRPGERAGVLGVPRPRDAAGRGAGVTGGHRAGQGDPDGDGPLRRRRRVRAPAIGVPEQQSEAARRRRRLRAPRERPRSAQLRHPATAVRRFGSLLLG